MNKTEFEKQTEKLYTSDTHVSPDFQCDQTGGFPVSLCVNWEEGKAWLMLNESLVMDRDDTELNYYRQLHFISVHNETLVQHQPCFAFLPVHAE